MRIWNYNMTGPKYIREEKKNLYNLADKINKIPFDFSDDGKTVNLIKVQKILKKYQGIK